MLSLIPLVLSNWRVFLTGGTVIAVCLWGWHEYDAILAKGAQQAIEKVEKDNAQSDSSADAAEAAVKACLARGPRFSWDGPRGVCVGS